MEFKCCTLTQQYHPIIITHSHTHSHTHTHKHTHMHTHTHTHTYTHTHTHPPKLRVDGFRVELLTDFVQ